MVSSTADRTVVVRSPEELEALASALAPRLAGGDRIALHGDLGAGKTVFVRGLARGLGHPDPREVVSPTFAIHNRYEGGRLPIDHLDLYRLPGPVRLEREGLDTVLDDRSGVLCCEWAERLADTLPGLVLTVRIEFEGERARRVTLTPERSVATRLLGG